MNKQTLMVWNEDSQRQAARFIAEMPIDKRLVVTVDLEKSGRSLAQNRLLHKWLGIIASEIGETAAETKEIYRQEFLLPKLLDRNGKTYEIRKSTATLTIAEMSEFLNAIYLNATQFYGIFLPVPDDQGID